ncbi:MAG: type II toxin-antitoxin system prevent-host-death family antitoxin [Geodermatophilaceae bacterium]|jgi:prevent-host-death family protein|nr:type II toxin-antitoxin system prevent-host-death family antitoxin [Geodermatophilaceae bacterium]
MERIGVRELRQHASRYLARVKGGEIIEVTDRGDPVARLVPIPKDVHSPETTVQQLIDAGVLHPATLDYRQLPAPLPARAGQRPLSEILEEMRNEERY